MAVYITMNTIQNNNTTPTTQTTSAISKTTQKNDYYDDAHAYMYVYSTRLNGYTRLICTCHLDIIQKINEYEGICPNHGRVGPGHPIKLHHLKRQNKPFIVSLPKEEKVRRNCFRTFLNRQEALDEKYSNLETQMGLLSNMVEALAPGVVNNFNQTSDSILNMTTQATHLIENMNARLESTHDQSTKISEDCKNFAFSLPTKIMDFVKNTFGYDNLNPLVQKALIFSALTAAIFMFKHFLSHVIDSYYYLKEIFSIIFKFLEIPANLLTYVWHYFKTTDLECQMFNTTNFKNNDICDFLTKFVPAIFPLIATIFTAFMLNKLPGKPATPDILLRRCRDLPGACKGLGDIYNFISKHWLSVEDYIKTTLNGEDPLSPAKGFPDIDKWMKDVLHYSNHKIFKEAIADKEQNFTIMQLWYTGMSLLTTYRKTLDKDAVQTVQLMLRTCAQMKAEAEKSGVWNSGPRMEPQMVWLTGGSGVGKSSMIYYLAAHILKPLGLANKIKEAVYLRTVEQEYWDGYRNQPLVAVDDAFQLRDGAANPNIEFMEAIRMSNMFPLNLHMADLTEKATTMFNGKCILYTTNDRSPAIESLTYPEAFFRRFTHCYEVRIKEEYQLERVDSSGRVSITLNAAKAKEDAPEVDGKKSPINLDVYEFVQFDPWTQRGKPLAKTLPSITFDKLANILETDMRNRVQKSDVLLTDVQQYAEKLHSQMGDHPVCEDEEFEECPENLTKSELTKLINTSMNPIAALNATIDMELAEQHLKQPITSSLILSTPYKFTTNLVDFVKNLTPAKETVYSFSENIVKQIYNAYEVIKTSLSKAYHFICNVEWNTLFTNVKRYLTSYSFIIPALIIGGFYLVKNLFPKIKNARKWRHTKPEAESFHPETQPQTRPRTLVTESFSPETQPQTRPHVLISESFSPETQPQVQPRTLVTESFHPETQPATRPHILVSESFHPETQPQARPRQLISEIYVPDEKGVYVASAAKDLEAQGCVDSNQYQTLVLASRQQYQIVGVYPDMEYPYGNGIVVKGSIMLTCQHFITYMKYHKPQHIMLRNSHCPTGIMITYDDFLTRVYEVEKKQDLVLVDLTRCVPPGKDIIKHFVSRDSLARLSSFRTVLSGYKNVNDKMILCANSGQGEAAFKIDYSLTHVDGTKETVYALKTISYDIDTRKGDCGMIATVSDYQIPAKIVGLHVAGSEKQRHSNFATLTTQETLREAISKNFPLEAYIGQAFEVFNQILPEANIPLELPFDGEFIPIGIVQTPGEALKTRIHPSSIYGKMASITIDGIPAHEKWNEIHGEDFLKKASAEPSIKIPARLQRFRDADGQLVDPLLKGICKAGLPAQTCRTDYLDIAAQAVASNLYYDRAKTNRPKRILTYEEAIKGISDKDGINGISRVTSPGYPWSQMPHKGKGKTHWMGHNDWDFTSNGALELRQFVDEQEIMIRNGQRLDIIWIDTLKDEVLPRPKVAIGKTRVFSNGPMHYTILFRKYFMMFMAHVMDNRISNEITVGIDPNSIEWQMLSDKITCKGPKVFDGDFAQYDGTLVAKILWKILDIINDWYDDGPTNRLARTTLWNDIVHSVHSCRGYLYQWTHSIPSGCPITAIVNSIYNSLSMRVVFLETSPIKSMKYFEENVAMASYGDDNIVNISDEVAPTFNQVVAAEGYKRIGMTYTDADKESELRPYKTIDEISFLKRYWRKDEYLGFYGAPSTLSSRLDILNWTRTDTNTDPHINEEQTVASVVRELAILGKDVFDFWTPLIRKAYAEVGKKMPLIESYTYYMEPMSVM